MKYKDNETETDNKKKNMWLKFEVLMSVTILWDVMSCSQV